jgi:GTP-binding protein
MRFVDEARLKVKAGDGGAGIVAWRREKFVPMGGPSGGNGGSGGDVIFVAKEGMNSLLDLKSMTLASAENGQKGQPKNKTGRDGAPRIITVPLGTIVRDLSAENVQWDLTKHEQRVVICRGGDGGFGNSHFKSKFNNAPEHATEGFKGEERELHLTLKLMADVGLLGFPNAGKSTLLTRLSNAKPKVADYPFTTLKPMVGVCELDISRTMIIADIPGLIEGASAGVGLGFRFLKHLERVSVLCHLIDASDDKSLRERFEIINKELLHYSEELFVLPQIIAINKIDILSEEKIEELIDFEQFLNSKNIAHIRISAATGDGLKALSELLYAKRQEKIYFNNGQKEEPKKSFNPLLKLY